MSETRHFFDQDNDGHWYLVRAAIREVWEKWLDIPEGDERGWTPPEGAKRLGGDVSRWTFTSPREMS